MPTAAVGGGTREVPDHDTIEGLMAESVQPA